MRWTAHEPGQDSRCLYGINRARCWDEFLTSLSYQAAPTLNYVFADQQGNIGYSLAGKIPIRSQVPSLLPLDGWNQKNEWKGYIPFDELPRLYNPPEGAIATANHRIVDSSYPYYLSHFFEPPHRIHRIQELFEAYGEIFNQCLTPTDQILGNPNSPWFSAQSRSELVAKSLQETCEELTQAFGDNMANWKWGRIHTLILSHSLGRIKLLRPMLATGP